MSLVLRYDQDKVPPVLRTYLANQGWEEYDEAEEKEQPEWNLWWKSARFTVSQLEAARYPRQRLNHFPKSSEITKKDTLLRNLRRMKGVHGQVCDVLPPSFILPGEYVKFCQAYAEARDNSSPATWICKPSELSRGRKIFVFKDIGELSYDCSSVVQQYIDRPLLLCGYKFDLRVYVLVTSFKPLRVYIYRNFLVRFGTEKYDISDLSNLCSHLTNTSLNKLAPGCEEQKEGIGEGCKWDSKRMKEWLAQQSIPMDLLWTRIETVVNVTLLSICTAIPSPQACFELYGFDLLVDNNLKPWLLEVNFSPALQLDGPIDEQVKGPLVADMIATLNICEPPVDTPPPPSRKQNQSTPRHHRGFAEVQKSRKAEKGRCDFVDSAQGDFEKCFPFSGATEAAADHLAVCPHTERDVTMRAILAEVKKKELPAFYQARALSRKLALGSEDRATQPQPPLPSQSRGLPPLTSSRRLEKIRLLTATHGAAVPPASATRRKSLRYS